MCISVVFVVYVFFVEACYVSFPLVAVGLSASAGASDFSGYGLVCITSVMSMPLWIQAVLTLLQVIMDPVVVTYVFVSLYDLVFQPLSSIMCVLWPLEVLFRLSSSAALRFVAFFSYYE